MAWSTNVIILGVLLALGTFLVPANNSGISAYMVSVVPDQLQGRVNATGGFLSNAVLPIAPALAGALIASAGGFTAMITGAALLAISLVPLLSSAAIRHLGRPETWQQAQTTADSAGAST